jgi:hypothetical protein
MMVKVSYDFRYWCVFIIEWITRIVLVNHAIIGGMNAKIYVKLLMSDRCCFVYLNSGKNKSLKKITNSAITITTLGVIKAA